MPYGSDGEMVDQPTLSGKDDSKGYPLPEDLEGNLYLTKLTVSEDVDEAELHRDPKRGRLKTKFRPNLEVLDEEQSINESKIKDINSIKEAFSKPVQEIKNEEDEEEENMDKTSENANASKSLAKSVPVDGFASPKSASKVNHSKRLTDPDIQRKSSKYISIQT